MAASDKFPIPLRTALQRRTTSHKEYDVMPSPLDGVSIRTERGVQPEMSVREMARYARTAATWRARKKFVDFLSGYQARREVYLKQTSREKNGLRGIVADDGNTVVSVHPQTKIEWNDKGLQDVLGPAAYPEVVSRDLELTFTIPMGRETTLGPMNVELADTLARLAFRGVGFSEEELETLVKSKTIVRVDEDKLQDMVASGQVTDVEPAGEATETWVIK